MWVLLSLLLIQTLAFAYIFVRQRREIRDLKAEQSKVPAFRHLIRTQNEAMRTYNDQLALLRKRIELNELERRYDPPADTFELALINQRALEESPIYKN